jgi:serine/threonine protein kinase
VTQPQSQPEDPQVERARTRVGMILQDKWKLDSLLGVGGMAAVYAATHRNGKRVAVKMLHAEMSNDEEIRQRFLREGYAANTLQHDGAVSVMDDDVAPDGSAFIVMELLEGETVEQYWERCGQRVAPRVVLAIADQVLDVLAAAHAKNVVHRDIKPENLFLTRTGVLKVLDFGIAKLFEGQPSRATSTRAGTIMGTPAFMAPEQALARWGQVDGRTDLWAVGATMFTLLSGGTVHEGVTSNEQLVLSATQPARSLATVAPGMPDEVVAIVDRALAFDMDARWPDALTMQSAVRVALEALGGPEAVVLSQRRPPGSTVLSAPSTRSGSGPSFTAETMLATSAATSAARAWGQERDLRQAEAAKLRAQVVDLTQRYGASKKRVAEAQATLEAARTERASLEQWFKRQVGTRTAAVEEARHLVRSKMGTLARMALADTTAFGAEHASTREQIAKLDAAAASAARDVRVHELAIEAHDPRALRVGVLLMGVGAVLLLALLVLPIVWRATRVIEPPPTKHLDPATAPSPSP